VLDTIDRIVAGEMSDHRRPLPLSAGIPTMSDMADFVRTSSGLLVPEHLMLPEAAAVYCDESGNSGPNYIDVQQPFYVLAGWLVPDDRVVEVNVAIDEFRKTHFRQRDELKSAAVLPNDATKRKCADLFRTLGQLHCTPMYLIAEKRFCVSGKIVETFLDPAYSTIVKNPFTYDVTSKQEIANTLYDRLPDDVIHRFAEAYRAPDAVTLAAALREVVASVEAHVSPELAKAIAGCEPFIDEIARVEAETSPLGDVAATLNMPCLVSFLMLVENLGRIGMAHPITVLHDQQHAYQDGYERIFKMHKGMTDWFARLPHTDTTYSNLRHVAKFEMRESKTSLPIQAADLLAGAIHHCCRLAMGHNVVTEGDMALAEVILPGLLVPKPRLTWIICSGTCMQAVGRRVFKPAIKRLHSAETDAEAVSRLDEVLAPMFPIKPGETEATPLTPKARFDLPMFGLVGEDHGGLMILDNPDAPADFKRIVVLFSSAENAQRFLESWDEDEVSQPQQIVEFDVPELTQLLDLLHAASEHAIALKLDPGDGTPYFTRVSDVIDNLETILDRVRRVFTSGMDAVMLQRHQVDSTEILSIQCHDGKYAAMIPPGGTIYFASTRNDAVAKLCKAEAM